MPRFGASYDVFGNGKTAAEVLHGPVRDDVQHRGRVGELQPGRARAFRQRTDTARLDRREPRLRRRLQLPEPGGQRRVRPRESVLREARSLRSRSTRRSSDGWNTREYSWDLTAGVTQEIAPRVSLAGRLHPAELGQPAGHDQPRVDAGRLRHVRLQRAAGSPAAGRRRLSADVPRHQAGEVPADRQLPDLRRQRRRRLQQVQRRRRHRERASARRHAPGRHQHRQRRRGLVRRGHEAPGVLHLRSLGRHRRRSSTRSSAASGSGRRQFCHRESGWQTNLKGLATYTVPKIDVLFSGTFRSLPYPGNEFPSVQSQSIGGTGDWRCSSASRAWTAPTSAGRSSSGIPVEFLNIVEPGKLYGDRLNSIDLRFGKILRYGNTQDA